MEWRGQSGKVIRLLTGDITGVSADAIVNAANSALRGGSGVDGAIHRAGGPELMKELDRIRAEIGNCPPGSAVVTTAGRLDAKYVFHAVGPIYQGGKSGEPEILASCYRTCLRLAEEKQLESISFPSISTGVYGYPMQEAAAIAIREVAMHLWHEGTSVKTVILVLYDENAYQIYATQLAAMNASRT